MKQWKKQVVTATIAMAVLGTAVVPALASEAVDVKPAPVQLTEQVFDSGITVIVNGEQLPLKVYRQGDCVMVPVRALGNALGCTVQWNEDRTIDLDTGAMHTKMTLGQDNYFVATSNPELVGMSAPFTLGAAPVLQGNVAYMPVELLIPLYGNDASVVTVQDNTVQICTQDQTVQKA